MAYKQIEETFLSNVNDVMNGYNLTRTWFNFRYDNPDKCKSVHTELYLFIVDLWNRLGQKEKFGLSTFNTMELLNIGSRNTYYKILKDLEDFGFIKTIQKSENQHQSRIIAISKIEQPSKQSLDQANIQATEQPPLQPSEQSPEHIDEQETNKPSKPINKKTIEERKAEFKNSLHPFLESYSKDLLNDFYSYWTEHNETGKKMRFEYAKNQPFNILRRLSTWKKNEVKFGSQTQKSKFEKGQDVFLQLMLNDPECQNAPAVIEYRKNNNLGTLKLEQ